MRKRLLKERVIFYLGKDDPVLSTILSDVLRFVQGSIDLLSKEPIIEGPAENYFTYKFADKTESLSPHKITCFLHTIRQGTMRIDPLFEPVPDSDFFGIILIPILDNLTPDILNAPISTKLGLACGDARPAVDSMPDTKSHMLLLQDFGAVYMAPSWVPCSLDMLSQHNHPVSIAVFSFSVWFSNTE